ncbi:hypothetical protein ACO2Q9_06290 [Variovorax sp. VNK109]|uniref:hypothetical protein n=1 Tax=Variovorax sp. VNK109 TaxID=3400919 RepID=UPI003C0E81D1
MRIDTETSKGEVITGAPCDLITELGTIRVLSGQGTQVKRSGRDLEINCNTPGQAPASAKLVSRANAGMAGNIIIGGAIGAVIDHNTGSAYTYPSWVKLVFGEYAVFDRKEEKEGFAMTAKAGSATKLSAAAASGTVVPTMPAPASLPASNIESAALSPPAVPTSATSPTEFASSARVGDAYDYVSVDHMTGLRQTITYRVDRVSADRVVFNSGAQAIRANGDLLELSAPVAMELDAVTPPGGWTQNGSVSTGMSSLNFTKKLGETNFQYELTVYIGPPGVINLPVGPVNAVRLDLRGWTTRSSAASTNFRVGAPYSATIWYSPELKRVVKFNVTTRSSRSSGGFAVDETLELSELSRR